MKRFFPFLDWITNYKKGNLSGDLIAGLTVGVMLIPQGMAYSMLADLPPIYGLYACTIPLFIYALMGTSRQLAVGPVAMVALLISQGVGQLAEARTEDFIALAILLALMVGVIQFAMGVFRLGFLVNFLSHPVIAGFTSAAALIIGFSQLKHLLGLDISRGKVHETLMSVGENFTDINVAAFVLGVIAIITLIGLKKVNKKIPGPLIVVLFGMGAVYFMQLDIKIVKDVPSGLPSFATPVWSWDKMEALLPVALTISLVGFMESIAVAKAIQKKHKNYKIDNNQELIGLGLANILGSFFKSFPVTGGFSRTAVNDQSGAKTGLASIISALLIVLTLLFLTPYFYYLPKTILSAIIMVAVFGLIDIKEAKHLWKTDRIDFALFMITAVSTLVLEIEQGIMVGAGASMLVVLFKISYPTVELKKTALGEKNYLIALPEARIYFANCEYIKNKVLKGAKQYSDLDEVVLDASAINSFDSSAVHMLHELKDELAEMNLSFEIQNLQPKHQVYLEASGFEVISTIDEHMELMLNE